jgi:cellulose synthase/poly-beta-1,6-N-acetylglucosamine synthase-like glycosyltransferase
MSGLPTPLVMLGQFDWAAYLSMFWFMILLELPRYTLSALAVFVSSFTKKHSLTHAEQKYLDSLKVCVVVAGHNEADAMAKCLRSLGEQTRKIDEIIVIDDGSTDGMREMIHELRRQGKISMALANQVRSGKAASCNFGFLFSKCGIIVSLDADCSYDRDAIEKLIEPFADPRVGATTGSVAVRNYARSAVSAYQSIEYIISIGMGKRVLDMLDMVVCVSGAFFACRREAVDQIGIMAGGPGEDFDMTLRLRRCGWKIRFAGDAWCFTDTPTTIPAIVRQRRRWDRDTIRTRLRKFRDVFHPSRRKFSLFETFEHAEWLVMDAAVTLIFPIYIFWVFLVYGMIAWHILCFITMIYLFLDAAGFLMALRICNRHDAKMVWTIAPYLLTFGMFKGMFMRLVRFYAYYEEWVHRASYNDTFSPSRVTRQALVMRD